MALSCLPLSFSGSLTAWCLLPRVLGHFTRNLSLTEPSGCRTICRTLGRAIQVEEEATLGGDREPRRGQPPTAAPVQTSIRTVPLHELGPDPDLGRARLSGRRCIRRLASGRAAVGGAQLGALEEERSRRISLGHGGHLPRLRRPRVVARRRYGRQQPRRSGRSATGGAVVGLAATSPVGPRQRRG